MEERKIAIVTGASRGIGRATAVELAKAGYYVVVNYNSSEAAAAETLAQVQAAGAQGEVQKFDVANADEVKEALARIVGEHKRIDVLVNNAGVTADGLFLMMGEDEWYRVINTILNGFYHVTKPVLREMVRKKRGAIVSVSSISAMMPNRGQANYAAAKAGIIAATRSMCKEVARFGIRVNVVAPGPIWTALQVTGGQLQKDLPEFGRKTPLKRAGQPVELSGLYVFLASQESSFITAEVFGVTGGMHLA